MHVHPSTRRLYKHIVGSLKALPPGTREYYRQFSRQHILSHAAEDDAVRLQALHERGMEMCAWVLRKYSAEK